MEYNLGLSQYKNKLVTGDKPKGSLGTSPKDNWGQAQGSYVNWSMALTGDYPNLVTW